MRGVVYAKLKKTRNILGLTQEEFAKKLGISRRTLQYYEKGKTRSGREIKKLPIELSLSIQQLITKQAKKKEIENETYEN